MKIKNGSALQKVRDKLEHVARFLIVMAVLPAWFVVIGMLIHVIGLRGIAILVSLFVIITPTMWAIYIIVVSLFTLVISSVVSHIRLIWHETSLEKRKKGWD